jgi:hypothetical protein
MNPARSPVGAAQLRPLANIKAEGETRMYGLIGKMRAVPGQRDVLISILLDGISSMPGCSYVIAQDPGIRIALGHRSLG